MADIAIEASGVAYPHFSHHSIVWTTSLIGYSVYKNSSNRIVYRKTTDGGQTWGAAVNFGAGASIAGTRNGELDIWYDKWTPGDTGTKIHLTYVDSFTRLRWRSLDTSSDTLGTEVNVLSLNNAGNSNNFVSITKARGGNLYVAAVNVATTSQAVFYRSIDSGATWAVRTSPFEVTTLADWGLLYPANTSDTQDVCMLYVDGSANELSIKIYDDSANSWGETAIGTMVEAAISTHRDQFAASVKLSDNHLIVAWMNDRDVSTADLKVSDVNPSTVGASGSTVTAKTDVFSNSDDVQSVTVTLNQNNNDIYVGYAGKSDGSEVIGTNLTVNYKKSSDGGTTWGSETAYSVDASQNIGAIAADLGGTSSRVGWQYQELTDSDVMFNYDNSIAITSGETADVTESFTPRLDETQDTLEAAAVTESLTPRLDDAQTSDEFAATIESLTPKLDEVSSTQEYAATSESFPVLLVDALDLFDFEVIAVTETLAVLIDDQASVDAVDAFISDSFPVLIDDVASISDTLVIAEVTESFPVLIDDVLVVLDTIVIIDVSESFPILIDDSAVAFDTIEVVEDILPRLDDAQVAFDTIDVSETFSLLLDDSSTVLDLLGTTETLSPRLDDSITQDDVGVSDSFAVNLIDAALGFDDVNITEGLLPRLDDSQTTLELGSVIETLTPRLDETQTLAENASTVTESFPVKIDDSATAFDTASLVESFPVKITETQATLESALVVETLRPQLSELVGIIDVTQAVDVPGRRIWAIIYDESGNKTGQLTRITNAWTEEAVNEVGRFELTVPSTETALSLISSGTQLEIWHEPEGAKFFGRVEQTTLVNTDDEPLTAIRGLSLGVELIWEHLFDGVPLNNVSASSATTTLLTGLGWTNLITGSGFVNLTNRYVRMTAYRALASLAAMQGGYIRETYVKRELEIKRGYTDSGIVLTNLEQVNPYLLANQAKIGVVSGVPLYQVDSSELINRLVPISGNDDDRIDLQRSTRTTPYTIQNVIKTAPSVTATNYVNATLENGDGGTVEAKNGNTSFDLGEVDVSGENRAVFALIRVSEYDISGAYEHPVISQVIIGGRPAVLIGSSAVTSGAGASHNRAYLYVATNVPKGKTSVRGVKSFNCALGVSLVAMQDVDQVTPVFASSTSSQTSGSTASRTLSSITTNMYLLMGIVIWNHPTGDATATPVSPSTHLVGDPVARGGEIAGRGNASGSVTMSYTIAGTGSVAAGFTMIAVNPAKTYYIEDTTSETAYHTRSDMVSFNFNRSPEMSLVNSANLLYDQAVDHLLKYKDPLQTLQVDVTALPLPTTWLVGDTMRFVYRGRARGDAVWLEKDVTFPVLKRRRTWDSAGIIQWQLTLGNVIASPSTLSDLIASNSARLNDIGA